VKIFDAMDDFFMKLTGIFYFGVYVEYRITGANIFRPQKGQPFNKYDAGKPQYRQKTVFLTRAAILKNLYAKRRKIPCTAENV